MSASIPGNRELPESQYDLSTYWGRVRHTASITDPRWVPARYRAHRIILEQTD